MTQSPTYQFQPSPWPPSEAYPFIANLLRAIADANAGPSEPPQPFPWMLWRNTGQAPAPLLIRNVDNSGWVRFLDDLGVSAIGEEVFTAPGPANALAALQAAPRPTAESGALGEWQQILVGVGAQAFLPAGGTWAYIIAVSTSGATLLAGVAAGGTAVATTTGTKSGMAWRVQ